YGDVIEEIDASVGAVLDALERLGLDDDTLVLFSSDNGPWLSYGDHAGSTGPLREGKGTTFEGGVRVPFLARWPGRIPAGLVCDEPAMTIDVLPTVAELIGAELPDSRSHSQFAVVINEERHPEVFRAGREQLDQPEATEVQVGGQVRARWVPVANDSRGEPKLANSHLNALTRMVRLDEVARMEVLVAVDGDERESVSGSHLADVQKTKLGDRVGLALRLDAAGGEQMRALTSRYQPGEDYHRRTHLAIVFDGEVHGAPALNAVIGSEAQIEGSFTAQEVETLITGLQHPTPLTDGHSLVSFLQGGSAPQRDYFYWELHEGASIQAVRFGDWKAVRNGPSRPIELYDLATDVSESQDVGSEHPELVQQAERLMAEAHTDHPDWPMRDRKPKPRR
ncbi:MAG: sulfatase-like hydrolase/transferase, partial [Planctomycetaceae bacterium]|nr:sulfatase-like hydrolase/transferase [Planctomycetaceae bacterium]